MDFTKRFTGMESLLTLFFTILLSAFLTFIAFLAWGYFAPMFNLPLLTFWEIWLLKIGVRILLGTTTASASKDK